MCALLIPYPCVVVQYHSAEDAKKAMDQLNGFELAGRPMKVGNVTDRQGEEGGNVFDADEVDRMGFGLGPTGRLQLMAKLAEGETRKDILLFFLHFW